MSALKTTYMHKILKHCPLLMCALKTNFSQPITATITAYQLL